MTVKELREALAGLPEDMPVFRDVEGEYKTVRNPHIARLHSWRCGGSITEDFMPETMLDDDEAKFKGVVLG